MPPAPADAPGSILIVHPDPRVREHLTGILQGENRSLHHAADARGALEQARQAPPDLLLSATRMRDMEGSELLTLLREAGWDGECVFLSDTVDLDLLTLAASLGVVEVLSTGSELDRVEAAVSEALSAKGLRQEASGRARPWAGAEAGHHLVGGSPAMLEVYRLIATFAPHDLPVLLVGETGTGKELVAREIHRRSPRSREPFEALRLGALSAALAASELFGHTKGAFTGAHRDHQGHFERAGRGTVFLDEIGELPLEVQPKLLAVLEERTFTALGGETVLTLDARIIAATHRDLATRVHEGRFREDLYHRLCVAEVHMPPLRERMDDLERLVEHLLDRAAAEHGLVDRPILSPAAFDRLRQHPWPGNIRQLANCLSRAVVQARHGVIRPRDLDLRSGQSGPTGGQAAAGTTAGAKPPKSAPSPIPWMGPDGRILTMEEADRLHIAYVLRRTRGNVSEAARLLRLPRTTLQSRMKALGIGEQPGGPQS